MKTTGAGRWVCTMILFGALVPAGLSGAEAEAPVSEELIMPVLRTRTATYTNVTVTSKDETKVFLIHSGGAGNVFVEDLDDETRLALGYQPVVPPSEKLKAGAEQMMRGLPMEGLVSSLGLQADEGGEVHMVSPSPVVIGVGIAIVLFIHLFFSYCAMLICRKVGDDPGLTVWVPIFQVFPLLKAAGMSAWWVLALLLPLVNLVASILWCFNIVKARGKSLLWAVLLLLPVTNIIAFAYLAFSRGDTENEVPPRMPGLAVRPA